MNCIIAVAWCVGVATVFSLSNVSAYERPRRSNKIRFPTHEHKTLIYYDKPFAAESQNLPFTLGPPIMTFKGAPAILKSQMPHIARPFPEAGQPLMAEGPPRTYFTRAPPSRPEGEYHHTVPPPNHHFGQPKPSLGHGGNIYHNEQPTLLSSNHHHERHRFANQRFNQNQPQIQHQQQQQQQLPYEQQQFQQQLQQFQSPHQPQHVEQQQQQQHRVKYPNPAPHKQPLTNHNNKKEYKINQEDYNQHRQTNANYNDPPKQYYQNDHQPRPPKNHPHNQPDSGNYKYELTRPNYESNPGPRPFEPDYPRPFNSGPPTSTPPKEKYSVPWKTPSTNFRSPTKTSSEFSGPNNFYDYDVGSSPFFEKQEDSDSNFFGGSSSKDEIDGPNNEDFPDLEQPEWGTSNFREPPTPQRKEAHSKGSPSTRKPQQVNKQRNDWMSGAPRQPASPQRKDSQSKSPHNRQPQQTQETKNRLYKQGSQPERPSYEEESYDPPTPGPKPKKDPNPFPSQEFPGLPANFDYFESPEIPEFGGSSSLESFSKFNSQEFDLLKSSKDLDDKTRFPLGSEWIPINAPDGALPAKSYDISPPDLGKSHPDFINQGSELFRSGPHSTTKTDKNRNRVSQLHHRNHQNQGNIVYGGRKQKNGNEEVVSASVMVKNK